MRKIKFRIWNKEINKMWSHELMHRNAVFALASGLKGKDFLIIPTTENHILMQYTGIKDKNGKEVYEGDIIQSRSEMIEIMSNKSTGRFKTENYEVRWQKDEGRWGRWKNDKFALLYGLNEDHLLKWYEVIGNIYENTVP